MLMGGVTIIVMLGRILEGYMLMAESANGMKSRRSGLSCHFIMDGITLFAIFPPRNLIILNGIKKVLLP